MSASRILWTAVLVALFAGATFARSGADSGLFRRGTDAYRRGEHAEAESYWRATLEGELTDQDRARVYYNLGNNAWRNGDAMLAVAWYTACLRLDRRHADARSNLEFVRSEEGLTPGDTGLAATLSSWGTSLRADEARHYATLCLVAFAVLLALEALRGGRMWRSLALLALLPLAMMVALWVVGLLRSEGDPVMVVRNSVVSLRSEPRLGLESIGTLDPGTEVERIDALPGWVRVRTGGGLRGWLKEELVFSPRPWQPPE